MTTVSQAGADGGQTPFAQSKGTVTEGGFRAPAMIRSPGKVPAGKIENGLISGLDWFLPRQEVQTLLKS
jgi:arylsulfatase A-like enzyme